MSTLSYYTQGKILNNSNPLSFLTSGAAGIDTIAVKLDSSWTSMPNIHQIYISLWRDGEVETPGIGLMAGGTSADDNICTYKLPNDFFYPQNIGKWNFGIWAEDNNRTKIKTSTPSDFIIVQGAPIDGEPILDWDVVQQELISTINSSLGTSLPSNAPIDYILLAIANNPKVWTCNAWDDLFANSSLSNLPFGRADNHQNTSWTGVLPYLNIANLRDGSNFFRGNVGLTEIHIQGSGLRSMKHMFNNLYSSSASSTLEKVRIDNLSPFVTTFEGAFTGQIKLKEIDADIDFTSCESAGGSDFYGAMFKLCAALEKVRFKPGTLSVELNLSWSPSLTQDSVISALRACRAVEQGSRIMTFSTAVYSDEIMPEITAAVNKGWKIAFGNSIYGG